MRELHEGAVETEAWERRKDDIDNIDQDNCKKLKNIF